MSLEVDEDDVLPGTLLGRSRLDLREVDAVAGERLQDPVEGAGHVPHREEDRGLVAPGRANGPATHDEEARRVLRVVLDTRLQDGDVVELRGELGGDRRHRRVGSRQLRRDRGRERLLRGDLGQVLGEPPRHCASACGCETTRLTSSSSAARDRRWWVISSLSSPQISVSEPMRRSSVTLTAPSVEFSTGTTPTSARPRSTSSKTSPIERPGRNVAAAPKRWSAAWCVNVACGPRYATVRGASTARQPDRIWRQTAATVSEASGPRFFSIRRRTMSASRSGAYDGAS